MTIGTIIAVSLLGVAIAVSGGSSNNEDRNIETSVSEVGECTTLATSAATTAITTEAASSTSTTTTVSETTTEATALTTIVASKATETPAQTAENTTVAIITPQAPVETTTESLAEVLTNPQESEEPTGLPITERERVMLCNLVGREYGSTYHGSTGNPVTLYERAMVVAVVMNRVNDPRFPNNIYDVLVQPHQFSGYLAQDSYTSKVTQSVIDSVYYYFEHREEFSTTILYFEGDGSYNYFY